MPETRTLQFPTDRAAGTLMFAIGRERESVPAQGEVEIPAEAHAMLQVVDPQGELPGFVAGDLTPLSALGPDDLGGVMASDVPPGGTGPIAHLTGLGQVMITGDFTDDDLAFLSALPALKVVQLGSEHVTGTGLKGFHGEGLTMLILSAPNVSPEGLREAAAVGAEEVMVMGFSLTSEHLQALNGSELKGLAIFGSCDVTTDELVQSVGSLPALTSLSLKSAKGEPVIDQAAVMALYRAKPGLKVNGTWLSAKALARLEARGV